MTTRRMRTRGLAAVLPLVALGLGGCTKPREKAPDEGAAAAETAAAPPVPSPAPPEAKNPVAAAVPQSYMAEREAQNSQCTDLETCTKECNKGISSACKVAGDQISVKAEETGKPADDLGRMKLYEKGCDAGSHSSCVSLAIQLNGGVGVPQDYRAAVQIRRKSCDAGYKAACGDLAFNVAFGLGTKQDFTEAEKLADEACKTGEKSDCSMLESIRAGDIPVVVPFASVLGTPKKYENKSIKLEGVHVSRVGPRRGSVKAVDGGAADALKAKLADDAGEQARNGSRSNPELGPRSTASAGGLFSTASATRPWKSKRSTSTEGRFRVITYTMAF